MSSVQHLREFICARLTAAAEEIFSEVEKTIEEEMDRQRRLLEISWSPQIKLPTADLHQHDGCEEEEDSSRAQREPEPAQIKGEPEELCTNEEGQLVWKWENVTLTVAPPNEDRRQSGPEPNGDRLLCAGSEHLDPGSTRHAELTSADDPAASERLRESDPTKYNDICESQVQSAEHSDGRMCDGKVGQSGRMPNLQSGEKLHPCSTCGKRFREQAMRRHVKCHTGERPYRCKRCGKSFKQNGHLTSHIRTHTGERPYPCDICGKRFNERSARNRHMSTHSAEKPFWCKTCGERFSRKDSLSVHMGTHKHQSRLPERSLCLQAQRPQISDLLTRLNV